jgi:hypothetical protein
MIDSMSMKFLLLSKAIVSFGHLISESTIFADGRGGVDTVQLNILNWMTKGTRATLTHGSCSSNKDNRNFSNSFFCITSPC